MVDPQRLCLGLGSSSDTGDMSVRYLGELPASLWGVNLIGLSYFQYVMYFFLNYFTF